MITIRDIEVVEFLKEYKIARTSTLYSLFFPSLRITQHRLRKLINEKQIKRIRDFVNNEYVYYYNKIPEQVKHSMLVTDFYAELRKKYTQTSFKIEPVYGSIRPDAIFGYLDRGIGRLGLLEVELSNKGFDWTKYDAFFDKEYKKYLSTLPLLCIVSNRVNPTDYDKLSHRGVDVVIIRTDMNNFRLP